MGSGRLCGSQSGAGSHNTGSPRPSKAGGGIKKIDLVPTPGLLGHTSTCTAPSVLQSAAGFEAVKVWDQETTGAKHLHPKTDLSFLPRHCLGTRKVILSLSC